ncbi:hypothetical protein Goshw_020264 [Gossypium schwendimanii]|uniref:Uncharacterized protein n=1 Tax=Gossypium schwendimanii TaxID=34291 RepID=A0A7J9LH74_GOSSC|nr:hypothetical protein [Gossypium schwendimanii]
MTAVVGMELVEVYSSYTDIASSPGKKFMTRGPFTSTRHCSVKLLTITKNSPLLPPIGV